MKKMVFVFLFIALAMPLWTWAQKAAPEPTPAPAELSLEQFWEEFATAYNANDAVQIQQLITANPITAEHMQQRLTESGKGTGEEAERESKYSFFI